MLMDGPIILEKHRGSLINELLAALLGYTGGLVLETEDGFRLRPENFLAEGERDLLEKILKVGYFSKKLHDYTATVRRDHFSGFAGGVSPGHYVYGMALRVDDTLERFGLKVMELEEDILENPKLQLVDILAKFQEETLVFGALHQMMMQVSTRELRGAALLDALWQTLSRAGSLSLERCLAWQLEGVGQIFVNQLVAWIIYGRLVDPYHEFFVQRAEFSRSDLQDFSQPLQSYEAQREWHRLFLLRRDAIPTSVLSVETARKVLFAGKSVRVLLRSNALHWNAEEVQDEVDTLRSCFGALPPRPSHLLERSLGRLRDAVAGQLREVLRSAHLKEHLEILKGFYLLGYGAFYQTLLDVPSTTITSGRGRNNLSTSHMLKTSWEKALCEHLETSRLEAERLRLQLVPRSFDLSSFDARRVKVMSGGRFHNGLLQLPAHSMAWLQHKVRISGSFQHTFSFQLRPVERQVGEYGARLALCFQPRWSPQDLQNRRHLERGADEIPEPLEMWRSLGESLTLEVQYCVIRSLQRSEVSLKLFFQSDVDIPPVELASNVLTLSEIDQMIHMVRLWYDSEKSQVQVFFGADAVAPCCEASVDLGDMGPLDMGCSYVGFTSLPLEQGQDRETLTLITWRHQSRERSDFEEDRSFEDLTLSYEVPWPLPLIVTTDCMERYNRLFQHLLTYRHATMELQRSHLPKDEILPEGLRRLIWTFHAQLSFFWTQVLQFFLQDVVEALSQKLLEVVTSETSRFDDVTRAHEEFLSGVWTHLFLDHRELRKELNAALRIAEVFRAGLSTTSEKDLRRLQHDFGETVRSFNRIMLSINTTGSVKMPLLVQLSARLEFNNFFSEATALKERSRRKSWWQRYGSDG